MNEIKNTKTARDPPKTGDIRTLQALDQAAGGSGDVAPELATAMPATRESRPQAGTDDARCEDSAESDRRRRREADEVHFKIRKTGSGSRPSDDRDLSAVSVTEEPRAPKHQRADAEIRAEIESRLEADGLLDAAGIFVTVSCGRVVVEGSVENHEAKQRAEAIFRQTDGIVGHDSNLVVRNAR